MDAQQKAVAFLIAISRIINSMKMYSPNHPVVKKGGEEANELLRELLSLTPQVTIGHKEGKLLLLGKRLPDDTPAAGRFLEMLEGKRISSVTLDRGATNDELVYFLELISKRVDDVLDGDRIKPELLNPLTRIRLNELRYAAVGADGEIEGGGGGQGAMVADAMLSKLFSEELANPTTLSDGQLASIFEKMVPFVGADDGGEGQAKARGYFEETFDRVAGAKGFSGMREALLGTVLSMQPEAQEALFGRVITDQAEAGSIMKTFAIERRAALIANGLPSGTDEELGEAVDALVAGDAELVELAELITRKLPGDTEGRRGQLSRLFKAMHGGDLRLIQPGLVYIADTDDETVRGYEMMLGGAGVEYVRFVSGSEMLRLIRTREPDLIIMDIMLDGATGIEVLSTLDRERKHIPVILCTAMKGVKDEFEVQMYPRMHFLDKPAEPVKLLRAIRERLPEPRAEGTAEKEDDLERARELQTRLVPDAESMIELPGFQLATFYRASMDVGGDYLDMFPIDEEHVGIIVADVSGKGITGAMVSVMLRSMIRMLAPGTTSPSEVLTQANTLMSRDLARGMFVSAVYGVLDLPTCKLQVAFAGHNPAVIYDSGMGLALMSELGGIAMGLVPEQLFRQTINEQTIDLREGDSIVLYTDGVPEGRNADEDEFGEDRLRKMVSVHGKEGAQVLVDKISSELLAFQGDAPQHDDITIVAITGLQDPAVGRETRRISLASLESKVIEAVDSAEVPVAAPAEQEEEEDEATKEKRRQTRATSQDALKRVQIKQLLAADPVDLIGALMSLEPRQLADLVRIVRGQEPTAD